MGWDQQIIEVVEADPVHSLPVKKQVWNGKEFVAITLYRHLGSISVQQRYWLEATFGPPAQYRAGQYWDTSKAGSYTVMDDRIYTWFKLKWNNR